MDHHEREATRQKLAPYMQARRILIPALARRISEHTGHDILPLTLGRFLNSTHQTDDSTVEIIRQFLKRESMGSNGINFMSHPIEYGNGLGKKTSP